MNTKLKVNLKGGFKTVQEGERNLEITRVDAIPSGAPNKLSVYMKDIEDGATLINNYNFDNDKGVWALGILLNLALGLEDGDEFDLKDKQKLVGNVLKCQITHSISGDKTYANVKRIIEKVDKKSNEDEINDLIETVDKTLYSRSDIEEDELD